MKQIIRKKMVSKMKEKCVVCWDETPYDRDTHIDARSCYVEGGGQLCEPCWDKVYKNSL